MEIKNKNLYWNRRIAIKIFLTIYLISALFFKPRLDWARFVVLTKSLTHYGTTCIDKIQETSGIFAIDNLILDGRTYISTTPGLSFIALISYFPYARFMQSKLIHTFSLDSILEFEMSQFIIALSTVILFTSLLIAIFFLSLRRIGYNEKKALFFSFLLYLGTPIIFYSLNITNGQNILEASLLFLSFFVISKNKSQNISQIFLSGLLCGLAIFVNITAVLFLPLFFFIIFSTKQWQSFLSWITGITLGITPLLIYNQISFGNIFKLSYDVKYGFPSFNLADSLNIGLDFLASPTIGLLFFSPFFILLIPLFKEIWINSINRFILSTVLIYTIGISILTNFGFKAVGYENWLYHNQGGGGPRYLLPIIPFLLYVMANSKFDSKWKKNLASVLIFVSIGINIPGLFWTGGQLIFYNNLLLFCKNGFHSYMIDLIKDILISGGFNAQHFSLFSITIILVVIIWWIWAGYRWVKNLL